jgi:hypothetical protein
VRGVAYWDPVEEQVVLMGSWGKSGLVEEVEYTRCADRKVYGTYAAKRGSGEVTKSQVVVDYSQPNAWLVKFTSGPREGETLSTWKRLEK